MTFFLSRHLFFMISVFPYFHILHIMNPIFCTLYTPYMHTHILFSRFSNLLFALVTLDTAYTIYFILIHHCTNSLSSLHIFVHHCTLKQALGGPWEWRTLTRLRWTGEEGPAPCGV